MRTSPAVFLDRDGVIVHEVDYLVDPKQLKLLAGSAKAIARLRAAGFKLIVISNQSAVARGMLTLKGLARITRTMNALLKAKGARLDGIYYCPHHPEAGRRIKCACRKPGQAMVRRAVKRFRIDRGRSFYVSDTTTDMMTTERAGVPGLLVGTGYGGKDGAYRARPFKRFKDLARAAAWIIERGGR